MISGTASVPRVVEESVCRSSKKYQFTEVGVYKIHATALMANIPFGEAEDLPETIDKTIFLNDKETELTFPTTITCQNYLTTKYIGRAPLEFYGSGGGTELGRQFILICRNGNPNEKYRVFGTEAAVYGYNKDAADMSSMPNGGE